ncbi:MAG: hypothetical protein JNL79_04395 [Myxococcales bacterium]|nr:hypothetical protein [Myxococcales bacterium]
MSYRKPDEKDERALVASQRLERLAAEGRRRRRALLQAKGIEDLANTAAERRRVARNLERSATRASILANPWFFGFASPAVAGYLMHLLRSSVLLGWVGLSVMGMLCSYLAGRTLAGLAVKREHGWVCGLPFELANYFGVLGQDTVTTVTVALEWEEVPPPEFFADVVAAFDPAAVVVSGAIERQFLCLEGAGPVRRWTHQLLERVLFPLHETHRLKRAEFSAPLPGD